MASYVFGILLVSFNRDRYPTEVIVIHGSPRNDVRISHNASVTQWALLLLLNSEN